MEGYHGGIIHVIDMIPGNDQDLLRVIAAQIIHILSQGIGRPFIPVRILFTGMGRQNFDPPVPAFEIPGLSRTDMTHQRKGFVLGQDPNPFQARIHNIAHGKIDNPIISAEWDGRLGPGFDQDVQPAADATG